jgi:hypothetical protein
MANKTPKPQTKQAKSVQSNAVPAPKAIPPATAGTYFLLLSPNERGGRRFVRLKAPTVLTWFQRGWRACERGEDWGADLRGHVYGLGTFFDMIEEQQLQFPSSEEELVPLLEAHIYYEKDIEAEPHFVHVETDDDEVDIEYFFFDDQFLKSPGALDRLPPLERRAHDDEDEQLEDADENADDAYAMFIRKLTDE